MSDEEDPACTHLDYCTRHGCKPDREITPCCSTGDVLLAHAAAGSFALFIVSSISWFLN